MARFVKYMPKSIEKNMNGQHEVTIGEPINYPSNTIYLNVDYIKSIVGPYEGSDEDKHLNKIGIWIVRLHYMDEDIINTLMEKSFCLLSEEETQGVKENSNIDEPTEEEDLKDEGFALDDEIDGILGNPDMTNWYGNGEFYFPSKEEAQKFIDEIIGK